jgi:hypothetical protein
MKTHVVGVIECAEFISEVIWDRGLMVIELENLIGHGHWLLSLGHGHEGRVSEAAARTLGKMLSLVAVCVVEESVEVGVVGFYLCFAVAAQSVMVLDELDAVGKHVNFGSDCGLGSGKPHILNLLHQLSEVCLLLGGPVGFVKEMVEEALHPVGEEACILGLHGGGVGKEFAAHILLDPASEFTPVELVYRLLASTPGRMSGLDLELGRGDSLLPYQRREDFVDQTVADAQSGVKREGYYHEGRD